MPLATPIFDGKDAWITPGVAVAVLALVFTVGSFWWIQVRRGRLRCYTSHMYSGAFGPQRLIFIVPLVLHNPAPAPLVVTDLRLIVGPLAGRETADAGELPLELRWQGSYPEVYPKLDTRSYAAPFAVDGRKAVEKFIEFQCDAAPSLLADGPYGATVEVIVEPRRLWGRGKWQKIVSYTFNTQLAVAPRTSLLPRSNDSYFNDEG